MEGIRRKLLNSKVDKTTRERRLIPIWRLTDAREVITKKGERASQSTLLSGFLNNFKSPSCLECLRRIDSQEWDFCFEHSSTDIRFVRFSSPQEPQNMNSPWRLPGDSFSVCWENLIIIRKVDVRYPRQFKSHVHNNRLIVNALLLRNVTALCSFEVINCCRIVCRYCKVSYMHVQLKLFSFSAYFYCKVNTYFIFLLKQKN